MTPNDRSSETINELVQAGRASKEFQPARNAASKDPCRVTFMAGNQEVYGTSLHFSERGVLIRTKHVLPLNRKVKLSLKFMGLKMPVEVEGEVVWTNMYGPDDSLSPRGMGVKFINLDRDAERLLTQMAEQYNGLSSIYRCYFS